MSGPMLEIQALPRKGNGASFFESFRAYSLWEIMHDFDAGRFYELCLKLCAMRSALEPGDRFESAMKRHLLDAKNLCAELELRFSALHIDETLELLERRFLGAEDADRQLAGLQKWIKHELKGKTFFRIESDRESYHRSVDLLGQEVSTAFKGAIRDIEEAGNCLALDRPTACVFHLMRVMELALRALGRSLNDPELDARKNPTWEGILRRLDREIGKDPADQSPNWKADPVFFTEATAHIRAVKIAWRNPTMHVDQVYDHRRALDVLNAVGSFMRHLATRMDEDGNAIP